MSLARKRMCLEVQWISGTSFSFSFIAEKTIILNKIFIRFRKSHAKYKSIKEFVQKGRFLPL